jgi:hypothetical protein
VCFLYCFALEPDCNLAHQRIRREPQAVRVVIFNKNVGNILLVPDFDLLSLSELRPGAMRRLRKVAPMENPRSRVQVSLDGVKVLFSKNLVLGANDVRLPYEILVQLVPQDCGVPLQVAEIAEGASVADASRLLRSLEVENMMEVVPWLHCAESAEDRACHLEILIFYNG